MKIAVEVAKELFGMFVADARLTVAVLLLVAAIAIAIDAASVDPVAGGLLLLAGSILVLWEATARAARNVRRRR